MRSFHSSARRLALLGVAAALAAQSPAPDEMSPEAPDAPRSILPEDNPPPSLPAGADSPISILPAAPETGGAYLPPAARPSRADLTSAGVSDQPIAEAPDPLANPAYSNVDLANFGALAARSGGYGATSFSGSSGGFLVTLAGRTQTPIASRWASIVLARALASVSAAPAGVNPADWVAARARLLMRLGHIELAKALVDPAPIDRFTPALYAAALDTDIAASDVAAACPMVVTGRQLSKAVTWQLAGAMCSSFEGDDAAAARAFDSIREQKGVNSFDVSLAERVASEVGGTRSANLEWSEVDRLNLYRLGLANATGIDIPPELVAAAPRAMAGLIFRAPRASVASRYAAAPEAAAQGVIGSVEYVDFQATFLDQSDAPDGASDKAAKLRGAFAAGAADRLSALKSLWGDDEKDRYAGYVLTAEAAMRFPVDKRFAADAPDLMLAAAAGGRIDRALLWWPVAKQDSGAAKRAWAIAALGGAPDVEITPDRFEEWLDAEKGRTGRVRGESRGRLVLAALSGLGRATGGDWAALQREFGNSDMAGRWAKRLQSAAAAGRRGEVALVAAAGLQAQAWDGVPPAHLRQIVAAYERVGLREEAKLVAIEALTRA